MNYSQSFRNIFLESHIFHLIGTLLLGAGKLLGASVGGRHENDDHSCIEEFLFLLQSLKSSLIVKSFYFHSKASRSH